MELSKKSLIIFMIVDLILLAVGIVCMLILKFNSLSLWLFAGIAVLILASSIIIWITGKKYKK